MKKICALLLFTLLLSACTSPVLTPTAVPTPVTITYPDEAPAGAEPERFGEGFFKGSFHSAPVFSSDGLTMWWAGEYSTQTIYTSRFENSAWSEPAMLRFSDSIDSYRDPFISPDGSKFYFISEEPFENSEVGSAENIWMMEKEGGAWGEPIPLPESINSLELHWTLSVDNDYNLYFAANVNNNWDIFVSRYVDGAYTDPVKVDSAVSSGDREFTPNIAPDGSYLLFSRMPMTSDTPKLYIAYRTDSGWSEAVLVANVPYCLSPIVTPDGKYVIYLSSPSSFAWRDASFIEELRP